MVSYARRIDECDRRERMIITVGAALLGEIACVAAGASDHAQIPKHLAFIAILLSGFCLAKARVAFEYHATSLRRLVRDDGISEREELRPEHDEWPEGADSYWYSGIILALLAGATIAAAAVWPVLMWAWAVFQGMLP